MNKEEIIERLASKGSWALASKKEATAFKCLILIAAVVRGKRIDDAKAFLQAESAESFSEEISDSE